VGKSTEAKVPKLVKLAQTIGVYDAINRPGAYERADVSNHSEDDQRAMVRRRGYSKDKHEGRSTLKRRSRFAELGLRQEQAAACEWYADAYAQRYETQGITARYGEGVKSGNPNFDHLPKTPEQEDAGADFGFARSAISPSLLGLFENVVLHGGPIGSRRFGFVVAVDQLLERIEGRVNL
jgi:hypothetical protein